MRLSSVFVACVMLSSCVIHRLNVTPVDVTEETPITIESPVKAHLNDGSTVVFPSGVTVADGSVRGLGERFDLTLSSSSAVNEISLDEVAAMESYQTPVSTGATAVASAGSAVLWVVLGAAAAVALFGSCPTVYSFDSGAPLLESELFSYSIAPSFQVRDIDRLGIKSVDNGILELEVRNEMLETHYIDQLEILEVTHSPDQLAYPDERGRPLIVGKLLPPSTAVDQSGRDVLNAVRTADDISWSTPDERLAGTSADDLTDHLDFEFNVPADVDDVAMVLRMRNSLLNTVLLYDVMLQQQSFAALDWMGHDLEHFGNRAELGLWYREHMGLTISVWKNGKYRKVTRIGDQGPIAWSERAVKLPAGDSDTLKVRLSFVIDNWRFDQVSLALESESSATRTVPVSNALTPVGDQLDIPGYLAKADKTYLITKPQDRVTLRFDVGDAANDQSRTFFLASEGYYIEWMRSEWLTQEHRQKFKPDDDALLEALSIYADKRDGLREQFEATKIPVR